MGLRPVLGDQLVGVVDVAVCVVVGDQVVGVVCVVVGVVVGDQLVGVAGDQAGPGYCGQGLLHPSHSLPLRSHPQLDMVDCLILVN